MAGGGRRSSGSRKASASKARKRGGKRREPARPASPRWMRAVGWAVLIVSFTAGFVSVGAVLALDRQVRARLDHVQFRVPSRVYSAPTILYPGFPWKAFGLRETLERLGYRETDPRERLPRGQFVWSDSELRVHLRAFAHPSRPEPARDVVLRLGKTTIRDIREHDGGSKLGAVLLEPEHLGAYYGPSREQRELVRLNDLPEHLVDAVLAVEDQRFESHAGIDVRRIVGALLANLRAGRVAQGGSTLTQQLVKNFFLSPERTFQRKLTEAVMALLVEARYEKDAILEAYLNEIYLGQRGATAVHGVGEAARLYFGKPASRLSVAESGLIAAIIQSPNGISPHRDPERARKRRDLVLDLMHKQGRLEEVDHARAVGTPLRLARVTTESGDTRFFLDHLHRQLRDTYGESQLTEAGLRIYSTLDHRLQRIAADALREGLARIEKRRPKLVSDDPKRQLQGCLVALRPQTGELLALVGGRDYRRSQFDRCTQAKRQPGSVFKPFVYIAGLEPRGSGPAITLASVLDDSPLELQTPEGRWRPQNHDGTFNDEVGVREAMERSLNVATVRLADEVGLRQVVRVARRLGIESTLPAVPSLALGTAEISPLELARAYATIANGGVRPETQTIEDVVDQEEAVLERREMRYQRVLDAGTAYLATSLLEGVATRGTAAAVRRGGLRGPIAAKTGTTDAEKDLWFVGFTPDVVAVVWVGFDDPRSVGLSSSSGALPIWRDFIRGATGGRVRGAFRRPKNLEEAEIAPSSGALALADCPERRTEVFLPGTLPTGVCPDGADGDERRIHRRFMRWLRERI
ncbi:MAG: PBP1A family penicillin-binding protein [Myxococcota bacterium]